MTVQQLGSSMSYSEFVHWVAFYSWDAKQLRAAAKGQKPARTYRPKNNDEACDLLERFAIPAFKAKAGT